MPSFVYKTMHPEMYHGFDKKAPFFEGWYYKLVSSDESHCYAIIPGVIFGDQGHAFIQVLNGTTGDSSYHVFPLEKFWASERSFEIRIDQNEFSSKRIALQVEDQEGKIFGELEFNGNIPWPITWKSPGIMGWYAWVPKMECYHGVISFDHSIDGSLWFDGKEINFNEGRGYIEKDWGESFPEAWIWFQSNHFDTSRISLTASVAIIPWIRNAFKGFIIGFLHQGNLYRFATYTGANIERLDVTDNQIKWVVSDKNLRLKLIANQGKGGLLRGPTRMDMGIRVDETLDAWIDVELSDINGDVLYRGQGRNAGLEVNGDLERLLNL